MTTNKQPPVDAPVPGGRLAGLLESILTLFWFGIWLVTAAVVVLTILGVPDGFSFLTPISRGMSHETGGPGGTWHLRTETAWVSTPKDYVWVGTLIAVPVFVLLGYIVGQLRAIFRSLELGSPFVAENARRLRRMGVSVLVLEVVRIVLTLTVAGPAIEQLEPVADRQRIRASAWPDFEFVFFGLAVLVLAEVFRRGTAMQDEQALTV